MILVIVGTHTQGFDRLVRAADVLAVLTDEQAIIQYGSSAYKPKYATGFEWATHTEMERLKKDARIVISHAGAGTIVSVLRMGKPIIIVPRLKRYSEHHNDHQIQLANALQDQGRVVVIQEVSGELLLIAIEDVTQLGSLSMEPSSLIDALSQRLQTWSRQDSV